MTVQQFRFARNMYAHSTVAQSLVSSGFAPNTVAEMQCPDTQAVHDDLSHMMKRFEMTVGKYDPVPSITNRWKRQVVDATTPADTPISLSVIYALVDNTYFEKRGVTLMLFPRFKDPLPGQFPFDLSIQLLRRCPRYNGDRDEDVSREVFAASITSDGGGLDYDSRAVPGFRMLADGEEDWLAHVNWDLYHPCIRANMLGSATLIESLYQAVEQVRTCNENVNLIIFRGIPNAVQVDRLATADIFICVTERLNSQKSGSSGFNVAQCLRFAEKCDSEWMSKKRSECWSVSHFKGKELGHDTVRWQHLCKVFGLEMKFAGRSQYEATSTLVNQMRVLYRNYDAVHLILKSFCNYHDGNLQQQAFLACATAADKELRLRFPAGKSELTPQWLGVIHQTLITFMLPLIRQSVAVFHWREDTCMDQIRNLISLMVRFKSRKLVDVDHARAMEPAKKKPRGKDKVAIETTTTVRLPSSGENAEIEDLPFFIAVKRTILEGFSLFVAHSVDPFTMHDQIVLAVSLFIRLAITKSATVAATNIDDNSSAHTTVAFGHALRDALHDKLNNFCKAWLQVNSFSTAVIY